MPYNKLPLFNHFSANHKRIVTTVSALNLCHAKNNCFDHEQINESALEYMHVQEMVKLMVILQCSYNTFIDSNCMHGLYNASVTCCK